MNKSSLLIASQKPAWTKEILQALQEVAEENQVFNKYCKVTIRPHPTIESTANYKDLPRGRLEVEVNRKTNQHRQIAKARAVLTVNSTMAMDALILGKLVILCQFAAKGEKNIYASYAKETGAFLPMLLAKTRQQFKKAMEEMHW